MPTRRSDDLQAAAFVAAVVGVAVITLVLFGRHWWCSVGDLAPWSWDTGSIHTSQHLVDAYSFTHVEHGLVFYALLALVARGKSVRWRFLAAIALESGWEILENSAWIIDRYREQTIDAGYYGDSILNSLADIVCCATGFAFAAKLRWWWSVALMLAIEVGLALAIRDNLILNLVMLTYRFDAILDWQAARGGG
jgi:hypothetical protein